MSDKLVNIEEQDGPYRALFQRILRMVPDRDKQDKNLQRLLAFRLRIDGEAALSEYLIHKIRAAIKCAYTGRLYDFLKDDLIENTARQRRKKQTPRIRRQHEPMFAASRPNRKIMEVTRVTSIT